MSDEPRTERPGQAAVPQQGAERGAARLRRGLAAARRAAGRAWTALAAGARRIAADPRARRLARPARVVARDAALAAVLALVALAGGRALFERVEPGSIGVRQKNWGSTREIAARDFEPGIWFGPRFLYSWHRVDARTNVVAFARPATGAENPPLELRTPKGPTAQVAVRVPYRVMPGSAHRIVDDGVKTAYRMRVKSTCEKVLVQELSRLEIDALSDPAARQVAADAALARLADELAAYHVRPEAVLVEAVYFTPTYEKKMQDAQLAEQTQQTNQVLHELKLARLDADALEQELDQARATTIAAAKRALEAERELWVEVRLQDQKIEIQALEQELAREKQRKLDELKRGFEAIEREERGAAGEALRMDQAAVAQELAREREAAQDALAATLAAARAEAEAALAALRDDTALGDVARARELAAAGAALDLELAAARVEGQRAVAEVERAARAAAAADRRAAERDAAALVAEGSSALAAAGALRDALEAQALAHPGARLVLAREAAANLNLGRVALDSKDPRVPSVLDLDELTALLIGAGE